MALRYLIDVTQGASVGASKLALTGKASFAFPIVLSKQALTLPSYLCQTRA
jgi:hypothetical protein